MKHIGIAIILALALSGCGSSSPPPVLSTQLAWQDCEGVEPWQAHSACLRDQYRLQDLRSGAATVARQSDSENAAAWMLMGGTALMNGYNSGQSGPMPMLSIGNRLMMCQSAGLMTTCN